MTSYLDLYKMHLSELNRCRDIVENEINDFIMEAWREDLVFCVEVEGYRIVITVMEIIDYDKFEQFIIKKLCDAYGIHIHYRELTTSPTFEEEMFEVEWGLSFNG